MVLKFSGRLRPHSYNMVGHLIPSYITALHSPTGDILGYYIGYKQVTAHSPYKYKTVNGEAARLRPGGRLSLVLAGLDKFTKYTVTVQVSSAYQVSYQAIHVNSRLSTV